MALCQAPNKQLQRTVIPNRWGAASASFHYAHAARWTRGRAAAELRRSARKAFPRMSTMSGQASPPTRSAAKRLVQIVVAVLVCLELGAKSCYKP